MKFSFRRRHWVLAASVLSTGAMGLAWTQSTGIDVFMSGDFVGGNEVTEGQAAGIAAEQDYVPPAVQDIVSTSFAPGYQPYQASEAAWLAVAADSKRPGESPSSDDDTTPSLDLVFEATGAGRQVGGMARFLGPVSSSDFGMLVAATAGYRSGVQGSLPRSFASLQPSYAALAPRELANNTNGTGDANEGGDSQDYVDPGNANPDNGSQELTSQDPVTQDLASQDSVSQDPASQEKPAQGSTPQEDPLQGGIPSHEAPQQDASQSDASQASVPEGENAGDSSVPTDAPPQATGESSDAPIIIGSVDNASQPEQATSDDTVLDHREIGPSPSGAGVSESPLAAPEIVDVDEPGTLILLGLGLLGWVGRRRKIKE